MKKKEILIASMIGVISIILFVVIALIVFLHNGDVQFDNSVRDSIYSMRGNKGGFIYFLFRFITEFGYLYVCIALGIVGIFFTGVDRGIILYVFGFLLQATLNVVFKSAFDRQRPNVELQWMTDKESSFPSGHSASVTFAYLYIAYYMFKTNRQKWLKYSCLGFAIIIIPLVILSRLILGMHYFTDTMAGMSVGLFSLSITVLVYLLFERYDLFTKPLFNFKSLFFKKNEKATNN